MEKYGTYCKDIHHFNVKEIRSNIIFIYLTGFHSSQRKAVQGSIFWPQILFLSPSPRSRIPVFFPNFSGARRRKLRVIMTKFGAKRRKFWVLPSQKLQNDLNWEEINKNGEEIWEIW